MTTAQIVPPSELASAQRQGLALIPPLQAETDLLKVVTEDDYHNADLLLTRIRAAQGSWLNGFGPKWRGIQAIITPIYNGLQGLYELKNLVLKPLEEMEETVKGEMKGYKKMEAARIAKEKAEKAEAARKLQEKIDAEARKLSAAKTVQAKTAIIGRQVTMQAEQKAAKKDKPVAVKAAGSSSRTVKKPVIKDFEAFVRGVLALKEEGDAPTGEGMSITLDLLQVNAATFQRLWLSDPDLMAMLPGVEIDEDIIIAGR